MQFSVRHAFLAAAAEAAEIDAHPFQPGDIIDVFHTKLLRLVRLVVDADEERLAALYEIPAAVVASDPIDLTDDGEGEEGGPGTRDWLTIIYIDWLKGGDNDEVVLVPIEARRRAPELYDGPTGYLIDQQRKLKKIGTGWESSTSLEVFGVLTPQRPVDAEIGSPDFDYPAQLFAALIWEMVAPLARRAGVRDNRFQEWERERLIAIDALVADAASHVQLVDDVPRVSRW